MANASGRPLSADDTQSRERLLCAAREQFSKRGYAATTTRDIARVAGINPAMIRYYFNNKAGLFQAVLHETIQPMLSMMHSAPMQSEQPDMLALVQQYRAADLPAELQQVQQHWQQLLQAVQVTTPDRAMDIMLNGWLLYQTIACRIYARAAFYQASGAYGFRDQLQDTIALSFDAPDLTRAHLLRAAQRQFFIARSCCNYCCSHQFS